MCYTNFAKLTEYCVKLGVFSFCRDNYAYFSQHIIVMNLIKMQIPAIVCCAFLRPISHSVSLATIGVCVFCAVTSVAALFIFRGIFVEKLCDDEKYLISQYIEEWKMLSQYLNDIDKGYGSFITIFTGIATVVATVTSIITQISEINISIIFYLIPLVFIVVFGYMGYQFRITAILHGHLAYIEDEINSLLKKEVFMWHSSLTEVYMAHNNIPNKTLMIPILVFVIFTLFFCFKETFVTDINLINVVYWIIVILLGFLVLIPFFFNDKVRWKTYKTDSVMKAYKEYISKNQ